MSDSFQAGVQRKGNFEACERCLHRLCFDLQQFCSFTITQLKTRSKTTSKNQHTLHTHTWSLCRINRFCFTQRAFYCLFYLLGLVHGILSVFHCVLCHRKNLKVPALLSKEFSSRKGDETTSQDHFRLHHSCAPALEAWDSNTNCPFRLPTSHLNNQQDCQQ